MSHDCLSSAVSEAMDAFVHGTVLASFCQFRLSSSVSRLSEEIDAFSNQVERQPKF